MYEFFGRRSKHEFQYGSTGDFNKEGLTPEQIYDIPFLPQTTYSISDILSGKPNEDWADTIATLSAVLF